MIGADLDGRRFIGGIEKYIGRSDDLDRVRRWSVKEGEWLFSFSITDTRIEKNNEDSYLGFLFIYFNFLINKP